MKNVLIVSLIIVNVLNFILVFGFDYAVRPSMVLAAILAIFAVGVFAIDRFTDFDLNPSF